MNEITIDVCENKEYIRQISERYIFFTFPNGFQKHKKINKKDLELLHEWIISEMELYKKMYVKLHNSYKRQKEIFDKTKHFYSGDEITEAYKINIFADIDMKISNENYMREWNQIVGVGNEAIKVNDRYWELYKLEKQIKDAYNNLRSKG